MAKAAKLNLPPDETLPIEEQIRQRAYELYVEHGDEGGSELDDWLQAEEEVQAAFEQKKSQRTPLKDR
jgi:hypothetical protein